MNPEKLFIKAIFFLTVVFLLSNCTGQETSTTHQPTVTLSQQVTNTSTPQPTITTIQSSPTPTLSEDTPAFQIQFLISTTSDWTTIRLVSGGNLYELNIASESERVKNAGIENNRIFLDQDLDRAEEGEKVEITVEALLTHLNLEQPLIFEIERGYLGSTDVELVYLRDETPTSVAVFTWEGIKEYGKNTQEFDVSPLPFLGSDPNEHIIIAQINFWYYGEGKWGGFENWDGSRSTPFTPYFGETYYASDPDWIHQQIEWAVEYGVDAFSIEWTTPRGIGCCGSMEDTLDDVFLKSPNIHKIRWAIFYDFVLRILQTEELSVLPDQILNFDLPEVYDTFVEDFVHFAVKYFHHPQYLSIDGRPVIYIWATNAFTGNFSGAMAEARQKVSDLGYDVYIVGDEVCYGCFNPAHAALFDGSSTFTFLMPGVPISSLNNIGDAAETTDMIFKWWREHIDNMKVIGRDGYVNFQPAWAPQYDESWGPRSNPIVVLADNKEQVTQMAEVARKHAEPAGEEELKLVWVNTWNCWGESTTIEPTIIDDNLNYPGGNYGFDFLEIIRDVFGEETYYTSP